MRKMLTIVIMVVIVMTLNGCFGIESCSRVNIGGVQVDIGCEPTPVDTVERMDERGSTDEK